MSPTEMGMSEDNWQRIKHCFSNPILIHPLPHTILPVSILNTIHHIAVWLSVCLLDSLDLDRCLSILIHMVKRLWIKWFPQLRFSERCRNLELTITCQRCIHLRRMTMFKNEWARNVNDTKTIHIGYCIVSIHLYSASYNAHQSEALPVRETQREERVP